MDIKPTDRPTRPTVEESDPKVTHRESKQSSRLQQFDDVCAGSKEVFAEKNAIYGDAIVRTGAIGATVEIASISARLEHMVIGAPDAGRSHKAELVEIVKDLHNYANILGIMIMEDNWRPG